jgi:hypothetical protein
VCKLLDQAAALPADLLPQFQMYRWAFVREGEVGIWLERVVPHVLMFQDPDNNNPAGSEGHQDFVPHVARISKLMEARVILIITLICF